MKASIRVAAVGLAALAWLTAQPARAQSPTMVVSTFHASASGQWKYTVTNTSPPGIPYNLTVFRVPFGSQDGVTGAYSDVLGEEWVVSVSETYTQWAKPSGGDPMFPGDEGLFGVFSAAGHVQTGNATAQGPLGDPFVPVEVEGPAIWEALTVGYVNGSWGTISTDPDRDPNDPNALWFPRGTAVTLTAHPIPGKAFTHWVLYDPNAPDDANYAAYDSNLATTIVMDGPRHVDAAFKCGSGLGAMLPPALLAMCALSMWNLRHRQRETKVPSAKGGRGSRRAERMR